MTDAATRTPAPPDALEGYEQLAAEVALLDPDRIAAIAEAWAAPMGWRARRRYNDAVQRAEELAHDTGRVLEYDGGTMLVADVAPAYARLNDLVLTDPERVEPVPVLVDVAYAILTADLLDGADLEAITGRWAAVLEGPESPDVPEQRRPVDDAIDLALVDQADERPAPRPRRRRPARPGPDPIRQAAREVRAARRAAPAARRRRLRTRGVLAFVAAVVWFAAASWLLGLASRGEAPAWLAGIAAVVTAILAVYGAIANASASRIRRR